MVFCEGFRCGNGSKVYKIKYVGLAQLDRAFGYGPKGRGFESSNPHVESLEKFFRTFLILDVCFLNGQILVFLVS